MSQVSKYKLSDKVYNKIFSLFPQFLYRMINIGKQESLVNTFFTNTEKIVIAKRVAIAFMLVKGYTYDFIVDKLKVSHGTVARIANEIKASDPIVPKELEKIAKEDKFVEFLNAIGYQVSSILPPKGGDWASWRRNLEEEKSNSEQPF